jgi:sigma-B regulation protein RsbU (phosphoserine phosphatase)
LQDGDVIVIYSDGITEANSPEGEMLGDERLLNVVSSNRHLDCKKILEKIYTATKDFTTTETFDDDLTCLVLKIDEEWKAPLLGTKSFTYAAALANLAALRKDLKEFVCQHYVADHVEDALNQSLAGVNEAATNIIQHAFPDGDSEASMQMILTGRPTQIEIELCHNGAAFTGIATILPVPEGHTESGYGLYIMEQSMDAIHYSRREDGMNRIVMLKNIKTQEAAQE